MEAESELQSQRSKYEALEQTWMAANENFLKFQQIANRDLQLAKSVMTETQLGTWESLRIRDQTCEAKRETFTEYVNGASSNGRPTHSPRPNDGYRLLPIADYEKMKEQLNSLTQRIDDFQQIPVATIKAENATLTGENETLEAQLVRTNMLYEKKLDDMSELTDKYADLEEAINDKVTAHLADTDPHEAEKQLAQLEREFKQLQSSMRHQLDQLRDVRKSRQEDIDAIAAENAFLTGAHRRNTDAVHDHVQRRLQAEDSPQDVISLLETIVVEERSASESRYKKLIDDRANLEEAFSNMKTTAQVAADEHRLELETVQSKLESLYAMRDTISTEARKKHHLANEYEALKLEYKTSRERQLQTIKTLSDEIEQLKST